MNFTDNKEQDGKQMSGMHSSKQYDQDLEWIRSKVLLMGGLVEDQFRDAMIDVYKRQNRMRSASSALSVRI